MHSAGSGEGRRLRALVRDRLGLALTAERSSQLEMAFDEAARNLGEADAARSILVLAALPLECDAWRGIIDALTIGETSFFRQRAWFRQLEKHVLRAIVARKLRDGCHRLQIWSAGCSTGEEAYTLAMMVDRLVPNRHEWSISIRGTDVNEGFLTHARSGIYSEWSLREVEPSERARYFTRISPERYQVREEIRAMVSFQRTNLATPSPEDESPGESDLTVCRNVLMHLGQAHQKRVARRLVSSLREGGWIAVTPAEAVSAWFDPLSPVNAPGAIFFHIATAKRSDRATAQVEVVSQTRRAARPSPPARGQASVTPGQEGCVDRASAFADAGDLTTARELCEAALRDDPLNYDCTLLLAVVCDEMDDPETALSVARNAVYLRPQSALAHLTVAKATTRLAKTERSRQANSGARC